MDEEIKQEPVEETTASTGSSSPAKKANPIAILSYIGILFLIPLLAAKDDQFAVFHAKQGMTLFIAEIITWGIALIPFIGWIIALIAWIVWIIFSILGIVNVLKGEKKELPLIGKYAKNWKI